MQILEAAEGTHKRLEGDAQQPLSPSFGEAQPAAVAADSAMQDAKAGLSVAAAQSKSVREMATEVVELLDDSEEQVPIDTSTSEVDVAPLENALPEPESAGHRQAQASTAASSGCQKGSVLNPSLEEAHKTVQWATKADWPRARGQDTLTDAIPLQASGMHEHALQAKEAEQKPSRSENSDIRISVSMQLEQSNGSDIHDAVSMQQEQSKTDSSSVQISICN